MAPPKTYTNSNIIAIGVIVTVKMVSTLRKMWRMERPSITLRSLKKWFWIGCFWIVSMFWEPGTCVVLRLDMVDKSLSSLSTSFRLFLVNGSLERPPHLGVGLHAGASDGTFTHIPAPCDCYRI